MTKERHEEERREGDKEKRKGEIEREKIGT